MTVTGCPQVRTWPWGVSRRLVHAPLPRGLVPEPAFRDTLISPIFGILGSEGISQGQFPAI